MTSMRFIWTRLRILSEAARGFDLSGLGRLLHPGAERRCNDAAIVSFRKVVSVNIPGPENRAHPQRAGEHEV
jgi:hypothetical protein